GGEGASQGKVFRAGRGERGGGLARIDGHGVAGIDVDAVVRVVRQAFAVGGIELQRIGLRGVGHLLDDFVVAVVVWVAIGIGVVGAGIIDEIRVEAGDGDV